MDGIFNKVEEALQSGEPVAVRLYAILEDTEKLLEYVVRKILIKYNKEDLLSPIYTSVKELAVNGTKANFKRVFFNEENIDIEDERQYDSAISRFSRQLTDRFVKDYAEKGKKLGLFVDVIFDYSPQVLMVKVINNTPVSRTEDRRIRTKFQKSMSYDDIAQFYMEAGDTTEGAGMGITLVTMMLKSSDIDPHGFTIRSNFKDHTIAKLEIPLEGDYTTSREKFLSSS